MTTAVITKDSEKNNVSQYADAGGQLTPEKAISANSNVSQYAGPGGQLVSEKPINASTKDSEKNKASQYANSEGEIVVKEVIIGKPQIYVFQTTSTLEETSSPAGNSPFKTPESRRQFVTKVFTVVLIMLSLCAFGALFPHFFPGDGKKYHPVRKFFMNFWWLGMIPFVVFNVVYILLICFHSMSRIYPRNIYLLTTLSVSAALFLPFFTAFDHIFGIISAIVATALLSVAIIIYAKFTSFDLTSKAFYIFCVGSAVAFFGISVTLFCCFMPIDPSVSRVWNIIVSLVFVVIHSVYLAYHTQLILGGRAYQITEDDWVFGAVAIFTNILGIFLSMLGLRR